MEVDNIHLKKLKLVQLCNIEVCRKITKTEDALENGIIRLEYLGEKVVPKNSRKEKSKISNHPHTL